MNKKKPHEDKIILRREVQDKIWKLETVKLQKIYWKSVYINKSSRNVDAKRNVNIIKTYYTGLDRSELAKLFPRTGP